MCGWRGVSFDEFVAIRQALEQGVARETALAQADVSVVQWRIAQRRWTRVLVNEAKRGGDVYRTRLRSALSAVMAAPPSSADAEESLATDVGEAAAPEAPRAAAMLPAPVLVVPPTPPPTPGANIETTVEGSVPTVDEEVLPFTDEERPPPPRVADEVAKEAEDMVGETVAGVILPDAVFVDDVPAARASEPQAQPPARAPEWQHR